MASSVDIAAIAQNLDKAAHDAKAIPQLTDKLTVEDAYAVQKEAIGRRLQRGEKRVGVKMGFTSRAKIVQMGISDMIWGRLTDGMVVEDGGAMKFSKYVHPRVEPEIAFLLKKELAGRVTPLQALSAVEAVAPAMEIIDSRYADFKFSLVDVIADNASSSGFVTGPWHRPDFDFANLGLVLSFDGRAVQVGTTAAILGDPLRALAAAARFAAEAGEPLQPGWIVMAGGATAAEALPAGAWVETEMQHLGRVAFSVA
jgi:2-oxo-3-hexenedioate decarboxylase